MGFIENLPTSRCSVSAYGERPFAPQRIHSQNFGLMAEQRFYVGHLIEIPDRDTAIE
eukprot:JP448089.1.p3 GENE.JP448089.1~~JP448089.1.p3  ORF type:complete len:57 (+),score=8.20 JP448089.1:198-368(+)